MKRILFLLLSVVFLFSCQEENYSEHNSYQSSSSDEEIILKERDSGNPWVPSEYQSIFQRNTRSVSPQATFLSFSDYLGYSYKNAEYPLENTKNLGHPVIDTKKLKEEYPHYLSTWKNNSGEATSFSYTSFNEYNSTSKKTSKVDGGSTLI